MMQKMIYGLAIACLFPMAVEAAVNNVQRITNKTDKPLTVTAVRGGGSGKAFFALDPQASKPNYLNNIYKTIVQGKSMPDLREAHAPAEDTKEIQISEKNGKFVLTEFKDLQN